MGLLLGVAIGGVALVTSRGREGDDLRVVETGFSEVVQATAVTAQVDIDEDRPLVSWATVIENTTADRRAEGIQVRVELLDESGEVVDEALSVVSVLPPRQLTAVTGFVRERIGEVTDVRAEVEETGRWVEVRDAGAAGEPGGDADPAPGGITTDDVEVVHGAENQPIVTFTATSAYDATIRGRRVHAVCRDRDGRVVAGWSSVPLHMEPPLAPGEPTPGTTTSPIAVPDVATIEVYVEPTDPVR